MVLNLLKKSVDSLSCPALVVFSKGGGGKNKTVKVTHSGLSKNLGPAIRDEAITGKHLECVFFRDMNFASFRHILVVGLGPEGKLDAEGVRQVAAQIHDVLNGAGVKEAAVDLDGLGAGRKAGAFIHALSEGFTLAAYTFDELKTKKNDDGKKKELVVHVASAKIDAAMKKSFADGLVIGQCVNFSRRLGDMPGNLMTPEILAQNAKEGAAGTSLKVTVWDRNRIIKERMGGLLGVSAGSQQEPRFIIMEYKGAAASKKPVVFVGKGLTFDSGGISLKPSGAMEEMKYDMCGGANVIGALLAIARLKLKVNAIGLIPATENMPSAAATKPGDVHTARNGKTFEINNTDAEGRLILADALCYASELEPQAIIDAATLTGAMQVALGNIHTGYFTRNNGLHGQILKAAEQSGEWVWRMPLTDFHVKDMKGTYADLSNTSSGKGAGSATAAAFLEQFVGDGIPWAHFDIAGTAWGIGGRWNYHPKKGASGVMVRTFLALAQQL